MRLLFCSLFLLFSLNLQAQQKGNSKGNEIVAQINNRKITLNEFNKKYEEVRTQTVNPPSRSVFLEDLVRYEMGVQEAEKRNLKNDPIVQERIRQELYKAFVEKEVGPKVQNIKVTEKDMRAWYKNNPELRTSHILIEYKPESSAKEIATAKKRAAEIYAEVRKSKRPFEELVKLYSDDPLSKQAGGDVGWQSRVTLVPAYYDVAMKMKVGQVYGLVQTQFGFHIIKLTGIRSYENANKRQLRAAVFDEKRRVLFNQLFDKVKKSYSVKTNPKLVE